MHHTSLIEILYLLTGIILPLFYIPQIRSIYRDKTGLSSYSTSKATAQLLLRLPALAFAIFVVQSNFMNIVLTLDVIGRLVEWSMAIYSLKKQNFTNDEIMYRLVPFFKIFADDQAETTNDLKSPILDLQVGPEEISLTQASMGASIEAAKAPTS